MADVIVDHSTAKAQTILDNATIEANDLRASAMDYTDNILAQLEDMINHYMDQSSAKYNSLYDSLNECMGIIHNNRAELNPPDESIEAQLSELEDDGFESLDL